jgi:hypothetical protein
MLSSCGFSALQDNVKFSSVEVVVTGVNRNDNDYDLSQDLKKIFSLDKSKSPAYRLEVVLTRVVNGYVESNFSNFTRMRVTFTANYKLINIKTGQVLLEDSSADTESFDQSFSLEYSNLVAEKYSEHNSLRMIAGEISTRVKAFFLYEEKNSNGERSSNAN